MTAQQLIERVLELDKKAIEYGLRMYEGEETDIETLVDAAPLLARMLLKAIEQRDGWAAWYIETRHGVLDVLTERNKDNAILDRLAGTDGGGE